MDNIISHNKIDVLMDKYLSNQITSEEIIELRIAVNCTSDEELEAWLKNRWDNYNTENSINESLKEEILSKINRQIKPRKLNPWRFKYFQIAASIVVILSLGLSLYFYHDVQKMSENAERNVVFKVGPGERASLNLPDGTFVRLNSETQLSYQQDFGLKDRQVYLKGEGYFKVVRDVNRKFIVNTNYLKIQVVGTEFNVYSYENKDLVEMSLIRGCVHVNTTRPPYQTAVVNPNEKIVYSKRSGKMQLLASRNLIETAWVSNSLVFRSKPLSEVFDYVSRKYGINVHVSDNRLLSEIYTGFFDESDYKQIFEILKIHFGFNYRIKDYDVYIY